MNTFRQRSVAVLFVTAQNWKQLKYPSMDELLQPCQYDSAIKGNRHLIHATTWMGLKGFIQGGGWRTSTNMLHTAWSLEWHNYRGRGQVWGCQSNGEREEGMTMKDNMEFLFVMEQESAHVKKKSHRIIHRDIFKK